MSLRPGVPFPHRAFSCWQRINPLATDVKLSDHEARQSNLIDVMVLLSQNLSFHERDRGGDPGPVSSVRYVRPPLVKSEPVDRREHGHPKWIRLKSPNVVLAFGGGGGGRAAGGGHGQQSICRIELQGATIDLNYT